MCADHYPTNLQKPAACQVAERKPSTLQHHCCRGQAGITAEHQGIVLALKFWEILDTDKFMGFFFIEHYYPGQRNRFSREIHEVDLQFDHVVSCDTELRLDIDATRGICASRARVVDRSRCCMISHDRTADQSHEYFVCDDFFWPG